MNGFIIWALEGQVGVNEAILKTLQQQWAHCQCAAHSMCPHLGQEVQPQNRCHCWGNASSGLGASIAHQYVEVSQHAVSQRSSQPDHHLQHTATRYGRVGWFSAQRQREPSPRRGASHAHKGQSTKQLAQSRRRSRSTPESHEKIQGGGMTYNFRQTERTGQGIGRSLHHMKPLWAWTLRG